MIEYKEFGCEQLQTMKDLYLQEGWSAYLGDDAKLSRAFNNSLYSLGAFIDGELAGFIRCVGDGEHVLLVQDLIVEHTYRRQGIGTALLKTIWEKYSDVRMFCVVTDVADDAAIRLYESFGMKQFSTAEWLPTSDQNEC